MRLLAHFAVGVFRSFRIKGIVLFFTLIAAFSQIQAQGAKTPSNSIRDFIAAVNLHQYKKAYNYISKPLQEQMSFGEFHDAASRVKSIELLSVKVLRQTHHVAEARVIVRSLEKDDETLNWQKRKHVGELTFIPENGNWRIIQVNLKHFNRPRTKNKTKT